MWIPAAHRETTTLWKPGREDVVEASIEPLLAGIKAKAAQAVATATFDLFWNGIAASRNSRQRKPD